MRITPIYQPTIPPPISEVEIVLSPGDVRELLASYTHFGVMTANNTLKSIMDRLVAVRLPPTP